MVGIVKYNVGNIYSVISAIRYLGKEVILIENLRVLNKIKFLILPGVGHFASGMKYLEETDLRNEIKKWIEKGMPFLGICLGFQLLFEWSEEGNKEGLGILKGKVIKFKDKNLKVPHMGWNRVKILKRENFFENIQDNSYFYFAHSYYVKTNKSLIIGETEYGINFPSVISKENIVGVQFHPEKSGKIGLLFLKNLLEGKWLQ
ncbi:MAG: imidazole glycerol phosphate synthase subunit HisH [Candidatus Omnitrophica bacterium]|nr:imidazole glycerol phosphate synthase subunit HisH [Candidatus Omnitrophota bacterium]MCM8807241.1 imidazole glycerol phosphate synthase subunit HisH [Candidatus Omnitrophota bacterium]